MAEFFELNLEIKGMKCEIFTVGLSKIIIYVSYSAMDIV